MKNSTNIIFSYFYRGNRNGARHHEHEVHLFQKIPAKTRYISSALMKAPLKTMILGQSTKKAETHNNTNIAIEMNMTPLAHYKQAITVSR